MNRKADEQLMLKYLLGDLSDEEKLRLEERFFTDKEFYEQLLAMEDELICEYAQGELSTQESEQFERYFLSSPEDRERVETAKALMAKISEAPVEGAPEPGKTHSASNSWWPPLIPLFGVGNSAMKFALTAMTMLLLFAGSWLVYKNLRMQSQIDQLTAQNIEQEKQVNEERERNQQLAEELERERNLTVFSSTQESPKELNNGQLPPTNDNVVVTGSRETGIVLLSLMPGQIRGSGATKKLLIPPDAKQIWIKLEVRSENEYASYQATLQTAEGNEIWKQSKLKVVKTNSSKFVPFFINTSLLAPGDYMITLAGFADDKSYEDVGDYYLTTLKK